MGNTVGDTNIEFVGVRDGESLGLSISDDSGFRVNGLLGNIVGVWVTMVIGILLGCVVGSSVEVFE